MEEREEKVKRKSGVLFFVPEIDISSNCHNGNSDHYHKKSFHLQSSFIGVIKTPKAKTVMAITEVINKTLKFGASLLRSITAPIVVSKYFTRSKRRLATFSLFRKYLSFMAQFKHIGIALSRKKRTQQIVCQLMRASG